MVAYIIRRVLWTIPVMLLATFLTFALVKQLPYEPFSDPRVAPSVAAEPEASSTDSTSRRLVQYKAFSPGFRARRLRAVDQARLPHGARDHHGDASRLHAARRLRLRVLGARRHDVWGGLRTQVNGIIDYAITFLSTLAFALPSFVVATLWVSGKLYLPLPSGSAVQPAVRLGLVERPHRADLRARARHHAVLHAPGPGVDARGARRQEYITTARSKGLPWRGRSFAPRAAELADPDGHQRRAAVRVRADGLVHHRADHGRAGRRGPSSSTASASRSTHRMMLATTVLLSVLIIVLEPRRRHRRRVARPEDLA